MRTLLALSMKILSLKVLFVSTRDELIRFTFLFRLVLHVFVVLFEYVREEDRRKNDQTTISLRLYFHSLFVWFEK